jgi:hypothetical protein
MDGRRDINHEFKDINLEFDCDYDSDTYCYARFHQQNESDCLDERMRILSDYIFKLVIL